MKNPFQKNTQLKQLRALSATFAILDEFARRGILHYHNTPSHSWEGRGGALLIEESLAKLKLAEGERGFKHFLDQVAQWQTYHLLQEAYEAHRIDIEAKAVRQAKKQYANLTKADIQRIRQNARENMEPLTTVPNDSSLVKEFDLFIIRATAPSAAQATESNGQLLILGHYDGKKLDMALWEDVKHNLQKSE